MTIERTTDAALVRQLATDPAIFPHVSDDYTCRPERWQPIVTDIVINLVARDRAGYFGFGVFIPRTWTCFEAHMGFLPRSYGHQALEAFRTMLAWIWHRTTAVRLVGEICVENRRAIAFAKRAGFEEYGINRKSRLRGGILRDQICLGISRP